NTFYYFPNAGRYPVALTVSDGNGCADTVIKTVEILPDFSFYIPNAFTPNDDGRNDFFYPVAKGVKFYEMLVFDRWGDEIFQTTDLSEGWNGYYKNEACKQDSYVWKIKLTTFGGEEKEYTGNVLLIR
ncbi:MAG: gliding motility-associated C-terminal domain-containing protein, partial [Bacteroidia bacterium]|nr:gliding motility-associated C-terminal domain-containing protein [Bacteroidia bacterium]